eukprot:TRINITY_DN4220_c0_g1_i8.p1 TRINITY_DN4220_c0_g1~~TRINITY_DN4220_c0_g1_i8.p1  ORF type:complete len:191 (-),score=32.05 TRINITY_DN4220_c0_g1_i8:310-882(-)
MALKRKKKGMRKKKVGGSKGKYLKKFQKKKRNLITCKGQLFSHTHRDLFAVGNETSMQSLLCTPSLSPNTFTNPSFRLFLYSDAKKNSISFYDYLQYYAELSQPVLTNSGILEWKLEYDFDSAYKESSLGTNSLLDLLHKLENDTELYSLWRARFEVLFSMDRLKYLCALSNAAREDYLQCLQNKGELNM